MGAELASGQLHPIEFDGTVCHGAPTAGIPVALGQLFGTADTLLMALRDVEEALPPGLLPFGEDDFGNSFCIGVSERDRDRVYFHDHTLGWRSDADQLRAAGQPVPEGLPYQTVELVAPTFEGFVAGLFRHHG